ncbi:MAG TPA: hypothetical protein VFZ88_01670 [Sphingomicrobium sp.]
MIQHIAVAILMQFAIAAALRSWAAGAAVASAWALSREITQAEYRWIEQFGSGLRANMPWWGGFDPAVWQRLDPWLDWMIPSLAVVTIACAMKLRSARRR